MDQSHGYAWKGGKPRCIDCGKEIFYGRKRCWACYSKLRKTGTNCSSWKGGKPRCIDCGKEIFYGRQRCQECYDKLDKSGKNSNRWKGGKPRCVDCGVLLANHNGKLCRNCAYKGKRNPRWRGGQKIHNGYRMIHQPSHLNANSHGYIFEHRLIMTKILGRPLSAKEVVHHIDGDRLNNDPNNLKLHTVHTHHNDHRKEHPQIENFIREYLAGYSSSHIAKAYNVTPRTVLVRLRGAGIKIRKPNESFDLMKEKGLIAT